MLNNLTTYLASPLINSQGEVIENTFTPFSAETTLPLTDVLLTVDQLALLEVIDGKKGLFLSVENSPENINFPLAQLDLIAIEFPTFADGRGYSFAALLRRQGFKGELRAVGDVFKDVLFYLKRSGFDTFALKQGKDVTEAATGVTDFSVHYQISTANAQSCYQLGLS